MDPKGPGPGKMSQGAATVTENDNESPPKKFRSDNDTSLAKANLRLAIPSAATRLLANANARGAIANSPVADIEGIHLDLEEINTPGNNTIFSRDSPPLVTLNPEAASELQSDILADEHENDIMIGNPSRPVLSTSLQAPEPPPSDIHIAIVPDGETSLQESHPGTSISNFDEFLRKGTASANSSCSTIVIEYGDVESREELEEPQNSMQTGPSAAERPSDIDYDSSEQAQTEQNLVRDYLENVLTRPGELKKLGLQLATSDLVDGKSVPGGTSRVLDELLKKDEDAVTVDFKEAVLNTILRDFFEKMKETGNQTMGNPLVEQAAIAIVWLMNNGTGDIRFRRVHPQKSDTAIVVDFILQTVGSAGETTGSETGTSSTVSFSPDMNQVSLSADTSQDEIEDGEASPSDTSAEGDIETMEKDELIFKFIPEDKTVQTNTEKQMNNVPGPSRIVTSPLLPTTAYATPVHTGLTANVVSEFPNIPQNKLADTSQNQATSEKTNECQEGNCLDNVPASLIESAYLSIANIGQAGRKLFDYCFTDDEVLVWSLRDTTKTDDSFKISFIQTMLAFLSEKPNVNCRTMVGYSERMSRKPEPELCEKDFNSLKQKVFISYANRRRKRIKERAEPQGAKTSGEVVAADVDINLNDESVKLR